MGVKNGADSPWAQPGAAPARRRPTWRTAAATIGIFVVALYLIELVDSATGGGLEPGGITPRTVDGLSGVAFAPVLHGTWSHLFANTLPVLVLGFLVLASGIGKGLAVTGIVWVVGGLGTWLVGGAGTTHIGASILVFGWLAYLLVRGLFTRDAGQILIGIVVFLVYGGLLWGVLPTNPLVSWQGHLFGAVGGVLAAWLLDSRRRRSAAVDRTAVR
ncbi:rhomboid family intramembrane serine protease [Rhodococcus rhodnii]|uniref:Peptidase S54 rhomboid domain-containing protein n=1 Tax=Rhodococcus rhodnii LMG 5362 TaxID=1273125 RepID=R7WIW8_9NOCA|nr:hypothetical protein Rrhod_3516 [Rhodococcus rhodnii LMG 5362]